MKTPQAVLQKVILAAATLQLMTRIVARVVMKVLVNLNRLQTKKSLLN